MASRNVSAGKTKKTILLVHGMSPSKKFIFQVIKKMNVNLVCLSKEKVSWANGYVDQWILADLQDYKACVEAIKDHNRFYPQMKINGAVTFWDEAVILTARLCDQFNLIGIPYEIVKKVKNKYSFRDYCAANNIMAPKHKLLSSKKDIPALEKSLRYPLVVKPIYGACSAFVVRADNREQLLETYDYIKNNIKSFWLAPEWENLELLVEEYIDGEEVDIDILMQNGKMKFCSVSDNFNKTHSRFFVDSGQTVPSSLPDKDQEALLEMAEETLEKLEIQNGCIHFEAKLSDNGPCPIEVNLRLGGDYVYSYNKTAWHVDLVRESVNIALGEYIKIDKPEEPYKYIIGWDLYPETSGILAELDIDKTLEKQKYFEEMYLSKEIGDAILRPPEGYDYLGWITVSGDNALSAQTNLQEALKLINYKVVHFDQESSLGKTARKNPLAAATVKKDFIIQTAKIEKVRRISLTDQRRLFIGIAGNKTHFSEKSGERSVISVKYIEEALRQRGYETAVFDFNNMEKAFADLSASDVNLVFNVTEGINRNPLLGSQATAVLEALQIPHTGASSVNIALCQDKIRTKKLFAFHEVPTAPWDYAYELGDPIDKKLVYPLVVKPGNADGSLGMTNSSVVRDKRELNKQLKKIIVDLGRPALVEEYIEGDEYEVSILGNSEDDLRVLPLSRSIFKKMPKGYWHIYTTEARRHQNPAYDRIILDRASKSINPKLASLITEIALDAYKIMQCQDYGRVGIRVDKDGNPYVLEVDTNPLLNKESEFVRTAALTGLDYGSLLETIISLVVKRYSNSKF